VVSISNAVPANVIVSPTPITSAVPESASILTRFTNDSTPLPSVFNICPSVPSSGGSVKV